MRRLGGFNMVDRRKQALLMAVALLLAGGTLAGIGSARAQSEVAPVGVYWQRVPHDDSLFGGDGDQIATDVAAGGPGFIAVGNDSLGPLVQPAVWTSTDGAAWQRLDPGPEAADPDTAALFTAVAANPEIAVAVGIQGVGCEPSFTLSIWGVCSSSMPAIWWSTDGSAWNRVPRDPAVFPEGGDSTAVDVVTTADGFYAIGNRRDRLEWDIIIWSSPNGRDWEIVHEIDAEWPLAAESIEVFDFGVVGFMLEHVDREVAPLAAVIRGGGFVLETSDLTNPTPARQRVSVGSAAGFTNATVGTGDDFPNTRSGRQVMWASGTTAFALGRLVDGARTVQASTDGIIWDASTAVVATEPTSFTAAPAVLATPDGLVAVQFTVRGTDLTTVAWLSSDGAAWQPSTIEVPALERVDAGFTGSGGIPGGVTAMAIAGDLAVAIGTDATGGDGDAAFWFSTTGPIPDVGTGEPEPGTSYTTDEGCVITTDAECPAANLDRADLSGLVAPGADLSLANLAQASMEGADLRGVNLDGANLQGADLRGADLTGASLESADLAGAVLDGATLTDVALRHTDFTDASLRAVVAASVDFGGFPPTVGAVLARADLGDADLRSTDLTSIDLRGANLDGADLTGANLSGAEMGGASLVGATIAQANFNAAGLAAALFTDAKAREASFTLADLQGAVFAGADLTRASLFGARLHDADLSDATIDVANFIEAILLGATLPGGDLDIADWGFTICPDGFSTSRWPSASCAGHE